MWRWLIEGLGRLTAQRHQRIWNWHHGNRRKMMIQTSICQSLRWQLTNKKGQKKTKSQPKPLISRNSKCSTKKHQKRLATNRPQGNNNLPNQWWYQSSNKRQVSKMKHHLLHKFNLLHLSKKHTLSKRTKSCPHLSSSRLSGLLRSKMSKTSHLRSLKMNNRQLPKWISIHSRSLCNRPNAQSKPFST